MIISTCGSVEVSVEKRKNLTKDDSKSFKTNIETVVSFSDSSTESEGSII